MRKIREVLRLHHDAGMGIRAISRSLKASPSTVREYLIRAKAQGLSWPLPESLDDARLLQRLLSDAGAEREPVPAPGLEQGSTASCAARGSPSRCCGRSTRRFIPRGCSTVGSVGSTGRGPRRWTW